MKNRLTYLFIAFIIIAVPSFAQNVTGEWYGVGNVGKEGNYSQYLSELILKQKGDKVYGEYNYYFKSAYIPSQVTGKYNGKTRQLELNIFPLLNYKAASINGADCPMQGSFILKVSKIETTLSGQFESTDPYKYTCPEINVRFKKEILTPEEKKQIALNKLKPEAEEEDEDDAVEEKTQQSKTIGLAESKKPDAVKVNEPINVKKTDSSELKIIKAPQVKEEPRVRRTTADLQVVEVAKIKDAAPLPIKLTPAIDPTEAITKALKKRSFEESPIIEVDADSLTLAIYDNGEVDGDTIALFHNRKLLAQSQRLSDKPIALTIHIDTTVHEISMYAQNLGSIPPNTAVCIIMAGDKRYELTLSSNFIRNGTIRFRKKTPAQIRRENEYLR